MVRTDDDTLYVLSLPGDTPQKFGHRHGGHMVEFENTGSETVDTPGQIYVQRLETSYRCPGCDYELTTSAPVDTKPL